MTYYRNRSGFWSNLVKFIIFMVASKYFFRYVVPIILILYYVLFAASWSPANNPALCRIIH